MQPLNLQRTVANNNGIKGAKGNACCVAYMFIKLSVYVELVLQGGGGKLCTQTEPACLGNGQKEALKGLIRPGRVAHIKT